MGMFDDLIPQAKPSAGMFDDLIPDQPRRGRGARGERRLTDAGSPFDWEATGSGAVAQGETMFGGLLSAAGRNLEEYAERSGLGPAVEFVGQLTNNPAVEAARETVPEALVETGETFRDLGRVRQEQIQDRLIESPDSLLADPIESAKYGAQQLIMSGGPTVAGLGAAYVGAPVAGLGLMGALAGGQKFGDVYEETGDLARANEAAIASAAFETIPEVIPMALVSTKVAKLFGDDVAGYVTKLAQESPALKAALTSGAEGASEALTEVGNIAYESLREGREITGDDAWKRVRDAAFVGAGMGGVIAAPVAVQDTINNARQPEAADPVAAGIQAADEIFEQAAQDSQADVQPVTSAAQPAPQPAQDAEIDALLTPELDITPETESALDAAVTPPLGEPMSGGRVLFRGDPAEIRQKIADAGLRNAGGILQEDGEPVGVYFSASVADQVREVLGGSEASNIESASPSPDQAEPVVQQDQRVAGNRPPSTPVMEGVNNGVQSDTSGAGAPRRQADGNDGSRPSELGGVGDADQIGTAESVSAVGGNQNLAGSRPLDPDERSRADFESRLAKASEGLPPERVEQLRQLYQERPRDRVTGLYRSEDLTDTVDIAHAESATTPAVYIEMDFANLGGLNKRVGNSAADPFLKKAADVARVELEGAGATIGVRKGGDEFGFVVRGITQEQADAAMDRARAKFAADPDVAALADTPNPKAGRGSGIGIHYGTAQIDPDVPVADTIKAADTLVEARKDGAPYGRREREAAGSDRTVTRAAQGAPGAVEPRDGRVDSPAPRSSAAAEEQGSRLSDDTQLSWVDNKIGMAERGGHAIREFAGWEAPGEAAQGPVVARTTWHDPDAWGGEAGFWQSRPDPLTEAQARKALKKYREGKRLGSREQRFIDYAKSEAAFRDEQFESENAKYAEELRLQSDIDRQALFDELKAEVLSAGYNLDASEETEALTLFGWVDRAMSAGVPKAAIEAIDFTAPETDQVREFASLIREYSSESREAQGSGVGVDQDTGAPRAEEAAEPAEARTESDPLELEALTPEQATERAEAEQARQRQERNEQRAADRAEQRRREQAADRQQAADRNEDMAANFRLGQSDAEVRNEIAGQNDLLSPVDQAAAESAQSPENDLPEPTEAQKEAGNYKLGHVRISGMDVSIETPAGSSRRPEWPPLKHHYGYIKRTEGADGDHVDVFLGPKAEGDTPVFVVNQIDPKTGKFDEHKVMIGFDTEAEARDGYAANYAKDWKGLGSVVEMSRDEFKAWLKDGDTGKPAGNQSKIEDPGGAGPIENFGEELQGGRTQRPPSLDQELSDDDIAKQPLSKIWPKAEVDKIEDKFTAALATVIRDIIPNKPRKPYALKRWVEKVKFARTIADLLIGKVGRDQVVQKMQEWSRENGARGLDNFAAKIALLDGIDRFQWSRIGDVAEYPNAYRLDDGVKTPSPFTSIKIDGRRELFRGAKSVADVIEDVQQKLAGREDVSGRIKFEIRRDQSKDEIFINKAGDSEYRRLKTFAEVEDARKFIANNYEDLVAAWEKVKARDNVKKVDVRNAKNRPRTAKDYRGGKDATEQMFTDAFGFRGVEFGKWVSQGKGAKERQGLINEVYDALLDLSEITGFPPRAMSLGGTLGLALGSRGRGAASAHFEPGNLVINLTKTKGAGSLAHEWFHALDNYFARQRGGERSVSRQDNFITYRPERMYVHKTERSTPTPLARIKAFYEKNPNAGYMNPDNWKPDPSHPQGVRPEVEERFAALVDALNESPMKARSEMNDKGEDGYWGRIIERGARSFENFVISKMMENGYQNDFLANVRSIDDFPRAKSRYPYLLPEEVAPISEAFDALFDVIQTREENGKTVLFQRSAATGMPPRSVQAVVNRMSAQWENAPSIRVIASMSEAPEVVRLEDAKQKRGGATGDPAGFWHQGTVYVVASGQASPQTVARTVLHEVKGHAGLRGAFPNLQPVLQRIIDTRSDQVRAKAKQYGLDMSDADQAFTAAEEVLAEMAETNPSNGLVKRAIAAIKQFLRKIGVLDAGSISNEEIVREYLAPAARFIEGRDSGGMEGVPAFQRGSDDWIAATAKRFADAIEEDGGISEYGIRILPEGSPDTAGASLDPSYRWDDGIQTDEELPGTSSIGIERGDVARAIRRALAGGYVGDKMALIAGDRAQSGEDAFESVIENAVILSVADSGPRFRRNQAQPDERTSVRKLWDGFLDRFVDEFTSLTQAERATEAAGIELTDKEKARRAENLRHGKFQEKVRQARRDYFEPIAKILGDAKLDREGLADYLWWRHAPERDAVLRAKHKGNPDPDALAGISPKEAQANIDALPQAERQAYEQAAALIDKLRAKTLQVLQDSGQVAPETVDALKSAYQFYVPLRGLPEGSDPELNTASKLYGVGKGLSVNQNPLGKKALGRKSKPSDIIEEMKSDLERALIGAEKQKVLRRVINLMAANPEIGSIDAVEHVKQEVNGLIQYVPKTITENTVTFLHKGKPVRLKMANPRLERALLNINETPVAAIQKLAKVTRWLSAVKTSLSPYFMLINPVRDGLFAGMGIGSEKGIKHLASFGKHYGAAWRAMYRDERNKLKYSAIDTYAKEFGRAGGKTGYTYANSIEDISSELNRLFTQYRKGDGPKGVATRIWYKAEDMIKAANNIAENATRLAVFASMRDNGASVEEAAQYAKEVTVNFNVRGAWGKNLNAAYMFFNASVQGSRRMMTLMKSPAFAGTMVGLGLASYAIALKQMFDAGDDEDGESKYLKQIRDWDSQRAIPLRLGDEEYASIPVPYGPNVFSYLGWKAAELHYKVATGKDPGIADATADVATNLSNSMSPIQVDAGYWNAVPEVARIFLQPFAANINDFGNTISYAEKYAQPGDNTPAYQDADYRTGELFKLMSQFASVATGGDEYEGGAVNIAPEKLRYITQQGLGGMYRLINESMELGQKMMDDSPIEPRDVPLSNVYLRSRDLNNQQSETFYQNRDEVTELRRIYKAAVEREDEDRIEAMLEENPWLDGSELSGNSRLGKKLQAGTPVGELRNAEREIRELRRERQDAYTGLGEYEGMVRRDRMKRVREIDREIANAQRYFNASMNDRSPSQSLPAVQ